MGVALSTYGGASGEALAQTWEAIFDHLSAAAKEHPPIPADPVSDAVRLE